MLWTIALLVLLALLALTHVAESKTMWGARRKKDDDDEGSKGGSNFMYRKKAPVQQKEPKKGTAANTAAVKSTAQRPKIVEQFTAKRIAKRQSSDIAANMRDALDKVLEMFDSFLEMPEFDEMVTADSMKQVLGMLPHLAEIPQVQELLESEDLHDPSVLRERLQESLGLLRETVVELKHSLTDPSKVEELLESLPPEYHMLINAAKSGDFSNLVSFLDDVPGMSDAHKSLLSKLLSGSVDDEEATKILSEVADEAAETSAKMISEVKEKLMDPAMVAQMKDQFLQNPELLQMMGVSEDMLEDDEAFGQFLVEQMSLLEQMFAADPAMVGNAMDEVINQFAPNAAAANDKTRPRGRANKRRAA